MEKFLIIGAGAILGANARYLLGSWVAERWGAIFPYGTLIINVTGSLLLGIFLAVTTERYLIDPRWRLFLAVGFLSSYTTFSTYTFESVRMIWDGDWGLGLLNLLGNNALGIVAAVLGMVVGKRL